jgi:hypothetical protein
MLALSSGIKITDTMEVMDCFQKKLLFRSFKGERFVERLVTLPKKFNKLEHQDFPFTQK